MCKTQFFLGRETMNASEFEPTNLSSIRQSWKGLQQGQSTVITDKRLNFLNCSQKETEGKIE